MSKWLPGSAGFQSRAFAPGDNIAMKLVITQRRSAIRRAKGQKATIEALGFKRLYQTVEHHDTPQIRGMINKVKHLVDVAEVAD